MQRFPKILLPVVLFAIVFALFAPTIRYPLVDLDDFAYITQNRIILKGLTPASVRAAFSPSNTTATMYMPMLWLSYMADVSLFHASTVYPAPFHAVNVVLHALSAVLLFFILRKLHASPLWAFLLSLLWALHPLRVESVAWVTERKDTLAAFFGLAATLLWMLSATRTRLSRAMLLALAALLYSLGLLSKPSLVPLPLAWLALDVFPLRRIPASMRSPRFFSSFFRIGAEKLFFLPFALAAAWLAVSQHHAVSGSLSVPWPNRLCAIAPNFLFYVRKTFLPVGLTPLVPEQWIFSTATIVFSIAVCVAIAAAAWSFRRAVPSILPGTVWVLLFFLPASGLQPLPLNTVADRFFYLPAIGLSIALASLQFGKQNNLSESIARDNPVRGPRRRVSILLPAILALLLIPLATLTHRLLPIWDSTDDLYRHIASFFPSQPLPISHLAQTTIKNTGDFDAAEAILAPALAERPNDWPLRFVEADCILHRESPDAAIDYMFLTIMPEDLYTSATIFFLLANYEYFRGGYENCIRYCERALSLYARDSTARSPTLCLAIGAAFDAGDHEKALAFAHQTRLFANATSISIEHLLPLAIFHWSYCYREQAAPLLFRILDGTPGRIDIWNNILWSLATADWSPVPPSEILDRTLKMQANAPDPNLPEILDTIAVAQANAGDFDAALATTQCALDRLQDSNPALRELLLYRQSLFQSRTPYRERAFDRLFAAAFGSPADSL